MGEGKANPKLWAFVTLVAATLGFIGTIVAAAIGILPDLMRLTPQLTYTTYPTYTPVSPMLTPGPLTTSGLGIQPTSAIVPSFETMSFCLEDELNRAVRRCEVSHVTFTDQIERVYVSWIYNGVYVGMEFSRKWYRDNQLIYTCESIWDGETWRVDGSSEYTWLDAVIFGQKYFPPGSYTVELYIDDRLVQRGNFTIQK